MNDERYKIQKLLDELEKSEREIMEKNGDIAKKFFINTFQNKGFTDTTFEAWQEDEEKGTTSKEGELLIKTGNMKNSIKIENTTDSSTTITSDVDYAKYVNDGTSRMVGRKFIGKSEQLDKIIIQNVKQYINKIMNIK